MEDTETVEEPDADVFIVPTSHASEQSSQKVETVVDTVRPDAVAIELDQSRLRRLTQDSQQHGNSIRQIFTQSGIAFRGKLVLAMFSLVQSRMSSLLGTDIIGHDMLAGYETAMANDSDIALVDRDIQETFNRLSSQLNPLGVLKTIGYFAVSYVALLLPWTDDLDGMDEVENIDIDRVLNMMEETLPTFKHVLIDERNVHIANATAAVASTRDQTVLVIGAAHEPGVRSQLEQTDQVTVVEQSSTLTDTDDANDSVET